MVAFAFLIGGCMLGGTVYVVVWLIKQWTLPKERVFGYLTIDEQRYSTAHYNGYSIDSDGKRYTHIGSETVDVPNGYTLKFYPTSDRKFWSVEPIILHSLPGRSSILKISFGYGWITYSTDKGGKKYFVDMEPVKELKENNHKF